MKLIQVFGLLFALAALFVTASLLHGLGDTPSASTAGATGLGILGIALPLLGVSALLIIPSSAALCWPSLRRRFGIRGGWLLVWGLNSALSLLMLGTVAWAAWLAAAVPPP